jgi:hypothetical protein
MVTQREGWDYYRSWGTISTELPQSCFVASSYTYHKGSACKTLHDETTEQLKHFRNIEN